MQKGATKHDAMSGLDRFDTEAMWIVSTGMVGIGTNAPGYPLDVSMRSANLVRFGNSSQNVTLGAFTVANSSGNLAVRSANDLNLQSGASASTKMVLQAGGNVGIGTSSPNAKLEVFGTISTTNLVLNGVSITGSGSDRIVSGSINAIADVSSGAVRISGTLALNNTGSEPCGVAHYYTFCADPVTQQIETCRP